MKALIGFFLLNMLICILGGWYSCMPFVALIGITHKIWKLNKVQNGHGNKDEQASCCFFLMKENKTQTHLKTWTTVGFWECAIITFFHFIFFFVALGDMGKIDQAEEQLKAAGISDELVATQIDQIRAVMVRVIIFNIIGMLVLPFQMWTFMLFRNRAVVIEEKLNGASTDATDKKAVADTVVGAPVVAAAPAAASDNAV